MFRMYAAITSLIKFMSCGWHEGKAHEVKEWVETATVSLYIAQPRLPLRGSYVSRDLCNEREVSHSDTERKLLGRDKSTGSEWDPSRAVTGIGKDRQEANNIKWSQNGRGCDKV